MSFFFILVLMMWKVHSQENFILFYRENIEKLFESMLTNTMIIFFDLNVLVKI